MSVRYGARNVGYRTPAPKYTKRRHETAVAGDTQSAIIRANGGCLDFNVRLIKFETGTHPVGAHNTGVGQNGYTHCQLHGHRMRQLTRAERRLTLQQWVDRHGKNVTALNALRKRGALSRSHPINDYAMTWRQAVKFADRCDTVLCPELKDRRFTQRAMARYMASVCKELDYPLWPMALLSMWKPAEKCAAFVGQGYEFALIFGKSRYLAYGRNKIKGWRYKPTVIWGPRSARAWLN